MDTLTMISAEAAIRAALLAAGHPESTLMYGQPRNAAHWPYGFLVETHEDGLITIGLWDQVYSQDRTPADAAALLTQLARYAATLQAAGWAVTPGQGLERPYLVVTPGVPA